jgi:hypothetical protein
MKPGQPVRADYEYERGGAANRSCCSRPLEGFRRVEVTDRRTALDYAHDLSDIHFLRAKKIILAHMPKPIGASQPRMPVSSSSAFILDLNDSGHLTHSLTLGDARA